MFLHAYAELGHGCFHPVNDELPLDANNEREQDQEENHFIHEFRCVMIFAIPHTLGRVCHVIIRTDDHQASAATSNQEESGISFQALIDVLVEPAYAGQLLRVRCNF